MRTVLSSLAQQGEIERAGRGQYVEPGADTNEESAENAGDAGEPDEETTTEEQEDSMPTQEEYEQQLSGGSDAILTGDAGDDLRGEESDGDPVDEDDSEEIEASAAAGAAALPADPKTLGMILAAAVVLWFAYKKLGGAEASDQVAEESDESTEDQSDVLDGGLV
jgi:hypothetical protein